MFDPEIIEGILYQSIPFVKESKIKVNLVEKGFVKLSLSNEIDYRYDKNLLSGYLYTLAETAAGTTILTILDDIFNMKPVVKNASIKINSFPTDRIYAICKLTNNEIENFNKNKTDKRAEIKLKIELVNEEKIIGEGIFYFIIKRSLT